MSLKTWRASGVSADNAHGVIRPYRPQRGCRRAPGSRLNPWRDWPPRRGSARRPCTSPNIASQAEQAGIAQGAVRRGGCRRGFPCRAADRRGAGPLQLAGTAGQGAGANGGSAALDGMQGSRRCPRHRPSWRSSWAKRSCMSGTKRRNTGRSARAAAETPDDIAPRLDQFARVRCRCRRALAPLLPR